MDRPLPYAIAAILLTSQSMALTGNPAQGEHVFRACAACHSLESNRNMGGPSPADLWNRTLPSFHRYSPALKSSNRTLDD
jgi:cytochrome c